MSSKRIMIGAVVAIALALVIWKVRGGKSEAPVDAGDAAKRAPVAVQRSTRPSAPRVDPQTLAKASVAGTVTAADTKAPVAGARVCASGRSRAIADEMFREPGCALTGADGTYTIDGLVPAQYAVSAGGKPWKPELFHPDGDRKRDDFTLRAGEKKTGVDLVLHAGGAELHGTVSDISGGPIARARVWITKPYVATETDDKGAFSLWVGKGQHGVTAGADGYADEEEWTYAPGKVDLMLTPESTLAGTVVDANTSQPIEGARVTLGDWSNADATFSDAEGKFRIGRISPGRETVVAKTDRGYGKSEGSTLVGLGQHVDGVIVKLFPAARFEAHVVIAGPDKDKKPCASARASLHDADDNRWVELHAEPDGTVWADGMLPGDYKPELGCDGYQARDTYDHVILAHADVKDVVWEVDPGATIRGAIRTKRGDAIEDAEIWARTTGGAARAKTGWGGDESAADGTYELGGLKAGTYKIEVTTTKGLAPKDGFTVEVAAGATVDKDLVLDDGGTLTGSVIDQNGVAVAGIDVNTRLLTGGGRSWGGDHKTDDAGSFTIEGLRPGDYRVYAQRGWSDTLRKPGTTDDAKQGERVTVRAGGSASVKLVVEAQTGGIKGGVVDASGAPVGDAFVSAARESDAAGAQRTNIQDTRWSWENKPVLTGTDGTFELTKLSPGTYTLRAFRRGGGEAVAEHIEVGATGVKLQIKPTGSLEGIARGPSGFPDELSISVNDPKTGIWRSEDFYRTDGHFAIKDLPGGHFRVTAESAGVTKQTEIDLAEGEHKTINIELEKLITLTGKVTDSASGKPVPGVHMSASSADSGGGWEFSSTDEENVSDDAGAFTIKRAPHGKVLLRGMPKDWRDSDYAMLSVQVNVAADQASVDVGNVPILKKRTKPGDAVGELGVNFAEQPPETAPDKHEYKVSWIDPAGPAAKTELKVGDVVTTIDGTDVTGAASQAGWVLMRAAPGTKLALGLARGTTVTVTLAQP